MRTGKESSTQPTKPELRKYKAAYIVNDGEIGLSGDEVVVSRAP